ncbi:hypothetical protein VTL71DRAFT_15279 [Oculimacula yallundae]|uniref:F-box domain-containing protein n=1 Tax=Oculimacula yallundae TaxID=86028 RepID=A0ABR4CI69_9HELO
MEDPIPGFLRLPLELRLQIYTIALDQRLGFHPTTYLAISEVSKQIRQEVMGVYFKNSKGFNSLEQLAKWTARGPTHLLPQVSNISLHIFEKSLLPIADGPRKEFSDASSRTMVPMTAEFWESEYARRTALLIEDEKSEPSSRQSPLDTLELSEQKSEDKVHESAISSAWKSFKALSEVHKIWLVLKGSRGIRAGGPVRKFEIQQQLLLDMMAKAFPHLRDLTFFSNLVSLDFIRNFHDLRSLRFSGYSTSTVEETSNILRSLKYLDTIIIYRYPEHYDKENSIITSELPKYLSLTPEVIAALNPLKEFQIQHMTSAVQSAHITMPMIEALQNHTRFLRSLSLHSDANLDINVVKSVFQLTASAQLKHIHLNVSFRKATDPLDLDTILPKHIRHGEATSRMRLNHQDNTEQLYHLTITSSSSCLTPVPGDRICICKRRKILHIPNTKQLVLRTS